MIDIDIVIHDYESGMSLRQVAKNIILITTQSKEFYLKMIVR